MEGQEVLKMVELIEKDKEEKEMWVKKKAQ